MEVKILTQHYADDAFSSLEGYKAKGGYEVLKKALQRTPESLVDEVKASGLRGRGGAGFPTGVKWGFLPKNGRSRYLLCNADEGEPGTFKDRMMCERAPHQLIEGMLISAYAIGAKKSYIYVRGEYTKVIKSCERAIKEAYDAGILGKVSGSSFEHHMDVYQGAGAYICGEETGMISSLEGKKGQPKLKPPFPAVEGYLGEPTIVNNVETLALVTFIVQHGSEWFKQQGTQKSPGTKIFSLSGDVQKPGNYEVPLGYPLKKLIEDEGGGLRPGRKLKAVIPGGTSAPLLTAEEAYKVGMDFESLAEVGSMLGSGAVVVIDDSRCMVDVLGVIMSFYHHESCGQCTPCREGTGWLDRIVDGILKGRGQMRDLNLIEKVSHEMMGRTICALSDAAAMPALSIVHKFRGDLESFIERKGGVLSA